MIDITLIIPKEISENYEHMLDLCLLFYPALFNKSFRDPETAEGNVEVLKSITKKTAEVGGRTMLEVLKEVNSLSQTDRVPSDVVREWVSSAATGGFSTGVGLA